MYAEDSRIKSLIAIRFFEFTWLSHSDLVFFILKCFSVVFVRKRTVWTAFFDATRTDAKKNTEQYERGQKVLEFTFKPLNRVKGALAFHTTI